MNEAIQHARETVLSVLKPSRREIEHGMELHRNAIVCLAVLWATTPTASVAAARRVDGVFTS